MSDKKPVSDKKPEKTRRKILKSAALGGGVLGAMKTIPEQWSKPAIGAVVLPAHATTTVTKSLAEGRANINHKNLDYDIV